MLFCCRNIWWIEHVKSNTVIFIRKLVRTYDGGENSQRWFTCLGILLWHWLLWLTESKGKLFWGLIGSIEEKWHKTKVSIDTLKIMVADRIWMFVDNIFLMFEILNVLCWIWFTSLFSHLNHANLKKEDGSVMCCSAVKKLLTCSLN